MRKIALLIVAAVGLTATSRAHAATAPPCSALPDEPAAGPIAKLYIENGDTQEPMIKKMGKALINSTTGKIRLIYRNRPTCNIRVDMYTDALMTTATDGTTAAPTPRPIKYQPADGSDPVACTVADPLPAGSLDSAGNPPVPIQLGIGATYLSSCPDVIPTPDAAVNQFPGPVQAYGFITHNDNSQNGITAEEGYLSYGFTEGLGEANPWIVQALRFKRSNTASTSLVMAAAVRLKTTDMKAAPALVPETSAQLVVAVSGSTNPEATLGILGMDLRDANRSVIKMLPFKSFGQRYAYYPDKTKDSFEKQNVRDGHYLPWAPTPYMAKKDGTGAIADPLAKRFYDLVLGNIPTDDVDGLDAIAKSGLIPTCAMKVNRPSDGADLVMYADAHPCHCAFEQKVPSPAQTTCTACSATTPCGTGTCRFGYCEAQ